MNEAVLDAKQAFLPYPPYNRAAVMTRLSEALTGLDRKIVVLDDDPTGVQTVHGVYVYTDASARGIRAGFEAPETLFYLLTNSRGQTAEQSAQMHAEIAGAVTAAARETGKAFLIISRSDSTLRGHYPLETETLAGGLARQGSPPDGEVILPFFPEGGRYTMNNIHYVSAGERLVPAGQTEFARDKTFGYQSSDLREWVQEKTGGAYAAKDVLCVSLEALRAFDVAGIADKLSDMRHFGKIIVNAIDYLDVAVFVIALAEALKRGKTFLFRSAAALPKIIGGIPDKPLLTREELTDARNPNGGLIIAGSHVQRTTEQLDALRAVHGITFIEFNQHLALDVSALEAEGRRVREEAERVISGGVTAVIYTRRERFDTGLEDKEEELRLAVRISHALSDIVSGLAFRPGFIIAKGGITSSDVGTRGLNVRKARVAGQILPGVPVWRTGPESRFPGLPYVIFPGNVGDVYALRAAVEKMAPKT
jgi:uncharacterized protein YgbK (DUF1537 family)